MIRTTAAWACLFGLAALPSAAVALTPTQPDAADLAGVMSETVDDETIDLTPQALEEVLSCRSRAAFGAFGNALFLETKTPSWMEATEGDEDTRGMLGLYAYTLSRPASMFGETVDTVYFMGDWVVTLWTREQASRLIAGQRLERAPIRIAEQYYRFIDPESGPMLGVFNPTGATTAAMLAKAFGAEPLSSPPAAKLFVGCNYTPVSQADFLDVARQSDAIFGETARDMSAIDGLHEP